MRNYVPKRINAEMLREMMLRLDVTHAQVQRATNMPKEWFNKMIIDNRHQFIDPDPERMRTIWKWLDAYERFQEKHNG